MYYVSCKSSIWRVRTQKISLWICMRYNVLCCAIICCDIISETYFCDERTNVYTGYNMGYLRYNSSLEDTRYAAGHPRLLISYSQRSRQRAALGILCRSTIKHTHFVFDSWVPQYWISYISGPLYYVFSITQHTLDKSSIKGIGTFCLALVLLLVSALHVLPSPLCSTTVACSPLVTRCYVTFMSQNSV